MVLCDEHSTLVNVSAKGTAMSTSAQDFCDDCRDRQRESELSEWQRGYQEAMADILAEWQLRGPDAAEEWIRNNRMHPAAGIYRLTDGAPASKARVLYAATKAAVGLSVVTEPM